MKRKYTLLLSLLCYSFLLQAQNINEGTVSQRLMEVLDQDPSSKLLVYTLLSDRVDAAALEAEFSQRNLPIEERVETLIHQLQSKATASQFDYINYLKNLDGVDAATIRPFWITNVVFMEANKEAIATLSNRSDVFFIDMNVENALDEYETLECALPPSPNGVEPGLVAIDAPALWAMGYSGYGQIAYSADTGIDQYHPAIKYKYRGYYADASETWASFNSNGSLSNNTIPENCGDHGNHTTGTMLGLDRTKNDTIGVAFNSVWIGSAILCGLGTVDNIAAFQWALDPDNNPATIDDMPDVINNSWNDNNAFPSPGSDCGSVYVDALSALEAAGIANVFSAGNAGPDPNSMTAPHNINTDTLNTFTVAAVNGNSASLPVADFSSRGPSNCAGMGSLLIKPEVSAPGVNVRSCELDGTYGNKSGTSMAAPHVCGAVLLLKEAFPYLTGKDLLRALYHTCTDLGDVGEDNDYGMGIISVLEAFELLVSQGNVPVPPHVENDVLIVDLETEESYCGGAFVGNVVFENAGTDELTSVAINYNITLQDGSGTPITGTVNWTGNLSNKERAEIILPVNALPGGDYQIIITLEAPNGQIEQKPLNNKAIETFVIFEDTEYSLSVIGIDQVQGCNGSNALLYCDYEGEGIVNWYSTPGASPLLHEGNYYLTPALNFDVTLYAEVKFNKMAGKVNLDESASSNGFLAGGLIIDVYQPFTIKSVKVYADNVGLRTFRLTDENGETIANKNLFIFEPGEQRVDVGLKVPIGENMVISLGNSTIPLKYSTEAEYPYDIAGIATVKTSNHPTTPDNAWFYFYDWEIEYIHPCGRKNIQIDLFDSGETLDAQFSSSLDIVNINNNEAVVFNNESINGVSWLWNFGDGESSTEESPSHLYTDLGIYTISLTAVNSDGCSDSFIKTVSVENLVNVDPSKPLNGYINIFPNPSSEHLHIDYDFDQLQELELKIMDALGRTIYTEGNRLYKKGQHLIDCQTWSNGLYYVMFTNGTDRLVKKIVRLD